MDDVRPNLSTLRFFSDDGKRYRIYVTLGGAIACDRFDDRSHRWLHMPLSEATEADVAEVLRLRYSTEDEQIARAVASQQSD
ncbi:MAG: hypothetical protein ACP5VE_10255 [Chthonomonadales bacterium]